MGVKLGFSQSGRNVSWSFWE